jgi:hypothetical protein
MLVFGEVVCSFLGGKIHVSFHLEVAVFSHRLTKSSSYVGVGDMNISTRNKEETTNLETKLLKVKPRQSQAPQP